VKRAGAVAAAGAALTLVALTFDAAPLFVVGLALVGVGALTPLWVGLAAAGLQGRRILATDRVVEGNPVHATVELRRGLFRPPTLELLDPLSGDGDWRGGALWPNGGGRAATISVVAQLPRRGRHEFPPPSLILRDPLELVEIWRPARGEPDEVLVLPRVERVVWRGRDLGASTVASSGAVATEPLAAVEIDGLRPYRVGTPASRIHWAALARGSGLLERRLRADADTRPLVVLDTRCPSPDAPALDAAVRAAASLTFHLARERGCGLLIAGDRRPHEIDPDLRAWPAVHVRLAVAEGGPAARPPSLAQGARLGRIFYVAAQPLARIPPALGQAGPLAPALVLPEGVTPATRGEPAFEVAGCRGYLLGVSRTARRRVA
jgi:uncharacterized protein (DUF58 family)